MIRIGIQPKTSQRLDLGPDAWLLYREATAIENEAGQAAARDFFRKARDGAAALADYGLGEQALDAYATDSALSAGLSSVVSLTEIGLLCISEWHGVGNEAGEPLELNRTNLCAMMRDPGLFALLRERLLARLFAIDDEGNGSKLSRNGAQAGADDIARDAETPEAPAHPGGEV